MLMHPGQVRQVRARDISECQVVGEDDKDWRAGMDRSHAGKEEEEDNAPPPPIMGEPEKMRS